MNKTERQETVDSLSALLKQTPHVYVTDFTGMSVLRMTEFRRRLRAAGVSYVVVKNTLARRAVGDGDERIGTSDRGGSIRLRFAQVIKLVDR